MPTIAIVDVEPSAASTRDSAPAGIFAALPSLVGIVSEQ